MDKWQAREIRERLAKKPRFFWEKVLGAVRLQKSEKVHEVHYLVTELKVTQYCLIEN